MKHQNVKSFRITLGDIKRIIKEKFANNLHNTKEPVIERQTTGIYSYNEKGESREIGGPFIEGSTIIYKSELEELVKKFVIKELQLSDEWEITSFRWNDEQDCGDSTLVCTLEFSQTVVELI